MTDAEPGCAIHGTAVTQGCPGCANFVDDLAIAEQVRERLANDTGERVPLDEFIAEHAPVDVPVGPAADEPTANEGADPGGSAGSGGELT